MSKPYERVTWRGKTLNRRTVAMLEEVERLLGHELYLFQGSYNSGGVSASAGTHDGGGAVDVWCYSLPPERVVHVMRQVGFAAWYRTPIPGLWGAHVHAIAVGDREMSSGAAAQVNDYRNGRDGLASHRTDSTWRPSPIPTFNYREAIDVQLTDKLPGKSGKTVGDALVAALNMQQQLQTFRQNIAKRDAAVVARLRELQKLSKTNVDAAELQAALRDVLGSLDDDELTAPTKGTK